jgi:cell division transport system permease protein
MIGMRTAALTRTLWLGPPATPHVLPWLLAFMTYVAALAGTGLLALADTVRDAELSIGNRLTVELPADISDARLQTALALLRQTEGVVSVRLFTPDEIGKLLAPWLGSAAPINELPAPRLIDVTVATGASIGLATLQQHLVEITPNAQVEDHRGALVALSAAVRRTAVVLAAGIAAALSLAAVAAVFATRAALAARAPAVELVYLLGATDAAIIRPFVIGTAISTAIGGTIGGVGVVISTGVLHRAGKIAQPFAPIVVPGLADWRVWATIVAVGLAILSLSTAGVVATLHRWLTRLP